MLRAIGSFVVFSLVLRPQLALGHHGGAEYDLGKTVEFKAKLTKVDLINPHAWLYFDVTEKDGKVSHHRCEMRSVHVLRRSGWTKELFPVNQQVTIEASPNKTDPASCYLQTILAADGTRMDRYGQYIKAPNGGIQEVRGPIAAPKNNRPARRPTGEPNIAGEWAPVQQVMVDPRGSVPTFMVNLVQRSWPYKTLTALRKQVAKPDLKDDPRVVERLTREGFFASGSP